MIYLFGGFILQETKAVQAALDCPKLAQKCTKTETMLHPVLSEKVAVIEKKSRKKARHRRWWRWLPFALFVAIIYRKTKGKRGPGYAIPLARLCVT